MAFPHNALEPLPWFFWASLPLALIGAFATRYMILRRNASSVDDSNPMAQTACKTMNDAPPCVRLPQGTYEGRIVTVGQNVVESAGLGLGVGAGGGDSEPAAAAPAPGQQPLPIPQQMALPRVLDVFLGIPYAESTAGANRFRAPVPLAADHRRAGGTIPATQLGQRCPGTAPNPFIPEGEDCLNLNVYRPAAAAAAAAAGGSDHEKNVPGALPVVVYVHGGGFNNGMGAERDMASFVGYADADLVGVSFNYRVGALGFLGWRDEQGDDGTSNSGSAPLNLGLRDQQALFNWVRKNIVYFGGDANNITIMGLSAGAHSIGHHLLYYPPGQAPFHKAILESGGPTARAVWNADHPRPQSQLREFLVAAGILIAAPGAFEASDAVLLNEDMLDRLRALPLATVLAASRAVWNEYQANVCWPFQPVIDGDVLPRKPLQTWQSGFAPQIPILTGFDSNEGTIFVPGDRGRADTDAHFRAFFTTLVPNLTPADLDELCRVYPDPVTDPSSPYIIPEPFPPGVTGRQWARLEAAYAHYAYICPVLQTAHYLSTAPANRGSRVYVYEFAAHALGWNTANHGDNQTAVAHSMAALRDNPGLLAVADAMNGAWVRFAVSGNPNGDGNSRAGTEWTPFVSPFDAQNNAHSSEAGSLMVFGKGNDERVPPAQRAGGPEAKPGTTAALRTLSDYEQEQCRFWWDRTELSQGGGQRGSETGQLARTDRSQL